MAPTKSLPMMISLPREIRDLLRKIAAEQNLTNTDQVLTAARLAREIICNHFANCEDTDETP